MFADLLQVRLSGIIEVLPAQIAALEAHYQLLVRWNKTLNLTRVEAIEEAVERHYCESLFLAAHLPSGSFRVADVGSGPGFPGFPVAVARPDCQVTLIESHQRKAVFLKEAARGIPNLKVIAKRAEEVRDSFDFAISRAVSYEDLTRPLKALAPSVVLLTGAEEPPRTWNVNWQALIALPWGAQRFLRIGAF